MLAHTFDVLEQGIEWEHVWHDISLLCNTPAGMNLPIEMFDPVSVTNTGATEAPALHALPNIPVIIM
jgi:hypothetical protein